jgi:tetratricopeptide (TPR) repeat protein
MKQNTTIARRADVDALNREAWAMRNRNALEMRALAERAKTLAESVGYDEGVAHSLALLAFACYRLGDYDATASLASQAISMVERAEQTASKKTARTLSEIHAKSLNALGLSYWVRGDFPNALICFQKALSAAEACNDKAVQAMSVNHIALVYRELGDFPNALEFHLKCKTLSEAAGERYMLAGSLNNIGVIYRRTGNFNEALAHFVESNRLYNELGNAPAAAVVLDNIGNMQLHLGDYAAALQSFQTAQHIHASSGATFNQTTSLLGMARAYFHLNKRRESETYFKKCLTLLGRLGDRYGEVEARKFLGDLYATMSVKKAIAEFSTALTLAEQLQAKDWVHQLHAALAKTYKQTGDFKKAVEHLERAHQTEREIYNAQSDQRLKNLQTLYNLDTAKRDALIEREKRERAERESAQKRGEITRLIAFLAEKNQLLESIRADVLKARTQLSTKKAKDNQLLRIADSIARAIDAEKEWKGFENLLNEVYPDFIAALSRQFPALTKTQLIICALIRLNLSSKDIAKIFYASDASGNRYRNIEKQREYIRKTLCLPHQHSLYAFLSQFQTLA